LFESYDSPYNTLWHFVKRDGLKLLRTFWSNFIRLYAKPDFNEKYVFFPLHFAEDAQIVTRCPFYYNQAEMLRLVAMSVPAGYKVYTKEHPDERGINSIEMIKQMKAIKNVKVLDPTANSHEIIKNSQAVVVISSSVGWEAFLYRKPVINLAPIYYGLSDLVYKVGDIRELPVVVKKALSEGKNIYTKYTNEEWEKFIYAILSTVNQGSVVDFWHDNVEKVSEETINNIADVTFKKVNEKF
jgi:Zn-finger protein